MDRDLIRETFMEGTASRLYQLLVEALRERVPATDMDTPVTVAEIYQELVPYRVVRDRIGVELNADYEAALLELLAGESGRLRLEPVSARDELRQELASPNPYLGIYRKFAACDVWVTLPDTDLDQVETEQVTSPSPGEAYPSRGASSEPLADGRSDDRSPAQPAETGPGPEPGTPMVPVSQAEGSGPDTTPEMVLRPASATPMSSCNFCQETLPTGRKVAYCPHCGRDQRLRPCISCGEVLEEGWRYCIACGTGTPAVTPAMPRL